MRTFLSKSKTPPGYWRYIQPETGMEFAEMDFTVLMGKVASHRKDFHFDLSEDWQKKVEHDMTFYNESPCRDPQNPQVYEDQNQRYGRKLWKQLHYYAGGFPESPEPQDIIDARSWFQSWEARVPFRGCACRDNWNEIRKIWEPDFSSRSSLVNACVDVHNLINRKLGKPIFAP